MQIKSILKDRSEIIDKYKLFIIRRNETIGLVGESGSGKSMLGCAILDMVPSGCSIGKAVLLFLISNQLNTYQILEALVLLVISQDPMQAKPLRPMVRNLK